jgi:hypothetical protein
VLQLPKVRKTGHNAHATSDQQVTMTHDPCIVVLCNPPVLQELRLKVLALRAFNLESMLIGEHIKSKEPIVTQIR